jgi:hypothetical protein
MRGFSCCTNHNTAAMFSFMKVTFPYFNFTRMWGKLFTLLIVQCVRIKFPKFISS